MIVCRRLTSKWWRSPHPARLRRRARRAQSRQPRAAPGDASGASILRTTDPHGRSRIGIWLIGAKGGVAATALVGLTALKKGWMPPVGLVSATAAVRRLRAGRLGRFRRRRSRNPRRPAVRRSLADAHRKPGHRCRPARASAKPSSTRSTSRSGPARLTNVGPTIEKIAGQSFAHRRETPRAAIERIAARSASLRRRAAARASDRRQRRLDRAGPVDPDSAAGRLGRPVQAARQAAEMSAAGQFAVCHRGARAGLFVHQFHAVAGRHAAGHRRVGPGARRRATWAATARPARRC